MSDEKPIVYILHGDDPFGIEREIEKVRERMGDPVMADLNTTTLDGRTCSMNDLINAAGAMPFLIERRLVILTHPLTRLAADKNKVPFRSLLNSLQPTTALVLLIEDEIKNKKYGWDQLKEKHWLRQWAAEAGSRVHFKTYSPPVQKAMPDWIRQQAILMGGKFDQAAASTLAALVGNQTRIAAQEILKLLTYVDYNRPVEKEDVLELTPSGVQTNVFEMVDKLSTGEASAASRSLHALLEDTDAKSLFYQVTRQFRLLIQTRAMLDDRIPTQNYAAELQIPPYIADKYIQQANRFRMDQLEAIYRHLLQLDKEIKTSKISVELALDTLILALKRA